MLYLAKTKTVSFCWAVCRVIQIGFGNWGSLQWRGWSMLYKILCNIDKHAILLYFSRLIMMSGRKNPMLLRVQSNNFKCETGNSTQSTAKYKYCIVIAKTYNICD